MPASKCPVGNWKPDCEAGAKEDTTCRPCSTDYLPANSGYVTAGGNTDGTCQYKCQAGYTENCQTRTCQVCLPGVEYYSNSTGACLACPAGASCDGIYMFPTVPGSVWEWENGVLRIQECPAGYILIRSKDTSQLDECVVCPRSYYSPVPASYREQVQVATSANDVLSKCIQCQSEKVECPGGSSFIARPGFWTLDSKRSRRMMGNSSLNIPIYRCSPNACQVGNNCTKGRTGVLCALCAPGYFFAGSSYGEDETEEEEEEEEENSDIIPQELSASHVKGTLRTSRTWGRQSSSSS